MLRKFGYSVLPVFALLLSAGPAHGISVGGETYDKFLSFETDDYIGYWGNMNKFYTYEEAGKPNTAALGNDTFIAPSLAGYDPDGFHTMGTTKYAFGPINSQTLALKDGATDLLTAKLKGNGKLDITPIKGDAGQFNITGLFDVTGGALFANNLVTGTIYAEIFFNNIFHIHALDYHGTKGVINLYWKGPGGGNNGGGGNPVPEPGTMALLASGLAGAGYRRLRKKETA